MNAILLITEIKKKFKNFIQTINELPLKKVIIKDNNLFEQLRKNKLNFRLKLVDPENINISNKETACLIINTSNINLTTIKLLLSEHKKNASILLCIIRKKLKILIISKLKKIIMQ